MERVVILGREQMLYRFFTRSSSINPTNIFIQQEKMRALARSRTIYYDLVYLIDKPLDDEIS